MDNSSSFIDVNIQQWVDEWLLSKPHAFRVGPFQLEKLTGDGSTRSFYRIHGVGVPLLLLHDPTWQMSQDYSSHQKFLSEISIRVPLFYREDAKRGFLVMQDLGDELLQKRIDSVPEKKLAWLKRAVVLLAELQGKSETLPASLPATKRCFDMKKYQEEFSFTCDHLVQRLLRLPLWSSHQLSMVGQFCEHLAQLTPMVFCHRDYHSRNILVYEDNLYLIDFQDARMGPPHYDLASLVFDAYVSLEVKEKEALCQTYKEHLAPFALAKKVNWKSFEEDLGLTAYQRLIKAAGSFASFYTRYGKPTHFPYMRPCLHSAVALQQIFPATIGKLGDTLRVDTWLKRFQELEEGT